MLLPRLLVAAYFITVQLPSLLAEPIRMPKRALLDSGIRTLLL